MESKLNTRPLLVLMAILKESKKCYMCKFKFKDPLIKHPKTFYKPNAHNVFSPEVLVHLKQTHGIPPEMFWEMIVTLEKEWQLKTT